MTTTYAELCQFINDAGMDLLTDENNNGETRACYYMNLLGTTLKIYIDLQDDGRLVQLYAYPRTHNTTILNLSSWENLHTLLNEFNKDIRYGRWSIDDDGDARVHISMFIEDSPLTRRQLSRIHFLLADLMIYQAQVLQIQGHIESLVPSQLFGISAVAVQTVIDHPSKVDAIAEAINATPPQKRLLYEVIGKVCPTEALEDESSGEGSDENDTDSGSNTNELTEVSDTASANGSPAENARGRGKRGVALH